MYYNNQASVRFITPYNQGVTPSASQNINVPALPSAEQFFNKSAGTYDVNTGLIEWNLTINVDYTTTLTAKQWENITITDDLAGLELADFVSNGVLLHNQVLVYANWQPYVVDAVRVGDNIVFTLDGARSLNPNWSGNYDYLDLSSVPESSQIKVVYYTTVPADRLPTTNNGVDIINNATFSGTDIAGAVYNDTASATTTIDVDVLTKTCETQQSDLSSANRNLDTLTYSIGINPLGAQLCPVAGAGETQLDTIKVIDELPAELAFVVGSLEVRNTSTGQLLNQDFEFDDDVDSDKFEFILDNNNIVLFVPDKTPLTITYKARMIKVNENGSNLTLENTVTLASPFVSNQVEVADRSERHIVSAAANLSTSLFFIDKIPNNDPNSFLPGAEFIITEYPIDITRPR